MVRQESRDMSDGEEKQPDVYHEIRDLGSPERIRAGNPPEHDVEVHGRYARGLGSEVFSRDPG